jgi:hypothetical protein
MLMGSTAITRTMQAALDLAEVTLKAGETTCAAGAVIGARYGIISAALRDPLHADHAELGRIIPEKMRAISESGVAILEEWWAVAAEAGDYIAYLGRAMAAGPNDVFELADRTSAHSARLASSVIGVASGALAPFHEKTTSNARRLARLGRAPEPQRGPQPSHPEFL